MRRLLIVPVLALSLAGCAALPTLNLSGTVSMNTLLGVEASYGSLLTAERAYKALPLCKTGTSPGVSNVCAKRSVIVRLQLADRNAVGAIKAAVAFVEQYPTVNASNIIGAAQSAVATLSSILAGVQ
jgi:hypothetical protein